MDDRKPTDDDQAMQCEPADSANDERDGQEVDSPPAGEERILEEAGYGYGV